MARPISMVKPQSGGLGHSNATTARRAFQIEFFTALPAKLDGKQSENLGGKDRDPLQVATCESAAEARTAVAAALRILKELGVQLHPQKTRIVHVRQGFEFLGYKIKRGKQLRLPPGKIRSGAQSGALYAIPREKSVRRFMDQVRALTSRRVPLKTKELIEELNPVLRGWGHYYKRAHVRKLFHRLDGWIVRRIRSHRFKRWRNGGWRQLPETKLYGEYGLVNLIQLIPSIASRKREPS